MRIGLGHNWVANIYMYIYLLNQQELNETKVSGEYLKTVFSNFRAFFVLSFREWYFCRTRLEGKEWKGFRKLGVMRMRGYSDFSLKSSSISFLSIIQKMKIRSLKDA